MTTTKTTTTNDLDLNIDLDTTALATIEKTAVDKLNKSAAKDDLDDFLRGARRSLLLVDTSSSMGTFTSDSNKRRIDVLRSIVSDLRAERTVPTAAFGRFYDEMGQFVTVRVVDEVPEPQGMTPLADAINFGAREGANHLVVVTDGEPDSQNAAYSAATAFGNPIDVFFVGDPHGDGATFAATLARMTGGTFGTADLGRQAKQLTTTIAGLLGDGN